jgi:ssDNA-specific exonuclease RecJ
MMKDFFKRLVGLDKLEAEKLALQEARDKAIAETVLAQQKEEQAKMTPKDRATAKGEPWVSVLDTHVNKDNIKNGFFELDWNDLFIVQLKQAGYGFDGDPDEEIVDRWFRDIVRNMLAEEGMDTTRGAGYINVVPISQGKSEVS